MSRTPWYAWAPVVAAAWSIAAPAPARAQEGGTVVVRGGWLFDGVGDARVRNPGIVIRGGVIIKVAAPAPADLAGAQVVEVADGETILPGFIDAHGHFSMSLVGRRRDEVGLYSVVFLANGVTTVFPAGEYNPDEMIGLRDRVERGEQPGPRIFSSGPYYGSARTGWSNDLTADSLRKDIDYWVAHGMKSIKAKGVSAKDLPVIIERAHFHGITVTGHLESGRGQSVNPRDAILMGIDRIDHFMGGDAMPPTRGAYESLVLEDVNSPEMKAMYKMFIDYHVFYDATMSTYGQVANPDTAVYNYWFDEPSLLTPYVRQIEALNPELLRPYSEQFRQIYLKKQAEIKAFYDAGGGSLITLATDTPSNGSRFGGFSAHREMQVLSRAGIPNAAVLKIATINSARSLGLGDKLGTIEPRKFADLSVVQGDPLADIRNTRNVRVVIRGGHVYDAKALLESVKGKIGPASAEEAAARGWVGPPRS